MAYHISITGIDGSGKSTSVAKVIDNLAKDNLVAKIGRPSYVQGETILNKKEYSFLKTIKRMEYLHELADNTNIKLAVGILNTARGYIIDYSERKIIKEYCPGIVVHSRLKEKFWRHGENIFVWLKRRGDDPVYGYEVKHESYTNNHKSDYM